jgi:hypothetical protein
MSTSPYEDRPVSEWSEVTSNLIDAHPLKIEQIKLAAETAWERLWKTTVGDASLGFPFAEADPPATVVGYFFEKLFAKELATKFPSVWRGGKGSEKDLHCLLDPAKSIEMKASGQRGYKVYGNRSYGQTVENADAAKKDKSGYYITINFFEQTLTMLRFGWIDAGDWKPQKSPTGQMAGLGEDVYKYKLHQISGAYILNGPVQLVEGVGAKSASELTELNIRTIRDLLEAKNLPVKYAKFQNAARETYQGLS